MMFSYKFEVGLQDLFWYGIYKLQIEKRINLNI